MQVTVNGKTRQLAEGCTALELVRELGLEGRRFAMEVNGEILPRSTHETHQLAPGDRVEVVHAVGGG
jgi:sulfur carrier protein